MVDREKAIDRIRKLLSLAKSPNEHEAANAATRAAKLMATHGIESVSDVKAEADPVGDNRDLHVDVGGRTRPSFWKWSLAWVVGDSARCKPYPLHRKIDDEVVGVSIAFIGRRSDAELCAQLYEHLLHQLKEIHDNRRPPVGRRIQQYVPGVSPPTVDRDYQKKWSRDFYRGMISMLHARMIIAREEVNEDASSTALVLLGDVVARVDEVASDMGLTYVDAPDPQVRSSHGFNAGIAAGRNIDLARVRAQEPAEASETRKRLPSGPDDEQ